MSQVRVYWIPVHPGLWSNPVDVGRRASQLVARNSSSLSWPRVTASVICPPEAVFRVVVTMRPARASKETDRITRVIITSSKVKPSDLFAVVKVNLRGYV
jgi:hypothetical protein